MTTQGSRAKAGDGTLGPRVALASSSTVATLLAVELALRLAGVEPPAVPRLPDVDRDRVPARVNALGLREPWDAVPPRREGEVRVAVLGDSFVFGEGVPREDALPAALERALTARAPGRPLTVFNLGVSDNDTAQEAARYRALEPALHPDVLVLVAYLNDFTRANPAYTLREIYDAGGEPGFFSGHSYLVAHAWSRVRLAVMRRRAVAWYRSSTLSGLDREFARAGDEIVRLRAFAEARGARFVLVFFPWLYDLDDYPLDEVHAHLRAFATRERIDLLDLLDTFRGMDADALRVSPANEHPNARAHRIAARAVAAFVAPRLP